MAGPWEKYQSQSDGPWAKYGKQPQSAPESPSVVGDVIKSSASGLARGAADLVGLPGTIGDAIDAGGEWVQRQLGLPTRSEAMAKYGLNSGNPLSGSALRSDLSAASGGATDYQPQTTAGEYSRTLGEFAPSAVAMPGSLIQKGAMAVVPALSSETAGQATKGTEFEPYARVLGAVAGGFGANAITPAKTATGETARDILNKGGDLYESAKPVMRETSVNNQTYRKIASDLGKEAQDFGLVPGEHDGIARIINSQLKKAQNGTATLADLETTRRQLLNAGTNTQNRSVGELSRRLVEKLDDNIATLGSSNIVGNADDAERAISMTRQARDLWRTGRKSEIIQDAMQKAQNAASGSENGLRIEFRKLLNNKKLARNFSSTEKEAIKKVANGTITGNALRLAGTMGIPLDNGRNYLGVLSGMLSGSAATGGNILGGVATTALGTGARALSGRMTQNAANVVDQMVKAGPAAQQVFDQLTRQASTANRTAILRAYLQARQALSDADSRPALSGSR